MKNKNTVILLLCVTNECTVKTQISLVLINKKFKLKFFSLKENKKKKQKNYQKFD